MPLTIIANYYRSRVYACTVRAAAPAAMQITPPGQFAVGFATARAVRGTQRGTSRERRFQLNYIRA